MPVFRINNHEVNVPATPPSLTLLEFLRDHLGLRGTKEGCASGDCGACTVIVQDDQGSHTLNSCITPLAAMAAKQVITVEGVGNPQSPHPVQQAMVSEHGSQCGYCTPGFVMSLVNHHQTNQPTNTREAIAHAIGGNLCRCTGYRPIIDAGVSAMQQTAAEIPVDTPTPAVYQLPQAAENQSYQRVTTMDALTQALAELPQARIVAGATDLWLEVTQLLHDFDHVIDISDCTPLQQIESLNEGGWRIGAAVSHEKLETFLAAQDCQSLTEMLVRFGSPQIRFRGTIGGNIGNASPIADWPPALLALDAVLVLASQSGQRRVPISEFYTGYRQTVLNDGECIAFVEIPDCSWQQLQFYKISKRHEDDISSVTVAVYRTAEVCRIGLGGVAATPVRLTTVETLVQQGADAQDVRSAIEQAITPISDVRASAAYRMAMVQNLILKAVSDE